jgi:hypothetical protein
MTTNSAISGYTDVRESYGENANIQVVATGPYGQTTVQSGDGGHYLITGLGNGTYSLNFKKEGYGTVKMYNIQLFGNDTAFTGQVSLFKKYDNFTLPSFNKISVGSDPRFGPNPTVIIETTMSASISLPDLVPIVLYTDSLNTVSYKSYARVLPVVYPAFAESGGGRIDLIFNPIGYLPFRKGTEVFFIAYVANPDEFRFGYFDKYLGTQQLSTLMTDKHSQVMSFIMP